MRGVRVPRLAPNTPEWLAWRAGGITAGDAAVILGLSPWSSPFDLWWQKRNDRDFVASGGVLEEREASQRFEIGHALEPVLDTFYRREAMPDGWRLGPAGCWQGRGEDSWLRATPDRLVYPNLSTRTACGCVEFKTSGRYDAFGEDDGSGLPDIPVHYRAQMLHQFLVLGVMRGTLTVLTAGMQIRHYDVIATDDEMRVVYEAARDFEQSLRDGVPPDVDGHEATTARVKDLWHDATEPDATVGEDLAQALWAADAAHRQAKADLDEARNRVLAAMGNAKAALTEDGRKVATRSVYRRKATAAHKVRGALDDLASTFPFDPRALVEVAPEPTVTLRAARPSKRKAQPIERTQK